MTPERWQRIEQLYHAALERAAAERAAYLAEACAGDETLQREVELLLSANEQASGFLTTPALELEAKDLAAEQPTGPLGTLVGQQLSHYKVLAHIGAGGMGEVYLARDASLERRVALKLLPLKFTADAERLQRFVREAKAASALNHPNIITIYEIGETLTATGRTHFIATEFIEGETLRERLAGELKLREILEIATQVASALDAAHKAGIVHRDIKPENLMVRPDGLVKVLDFGLAKLAVRQLDEVDTAAQTVVQEMRTQPGMILGTLRYMSPEQARGRTVDARSDIFSLGVVLYELLTGQPLFAGETTADVIAAIIHKEPPPLSQYLPDIPAELERIVGKLLAKERGLRYQTASELQAELQALKQELSFQSQLIRSGQTGAHSAASSSSTPIQPAFLSATWLRVGLLAAAGISVMLLAMAVWRYLKLAPAAPRALHFETLLGRKGQEGERLMRSRLSPDGKWVAFAAPDAVTHGSFTLWVMQLTGRKPQQITFGPAQDDSPIWSPDGERIAFVSNRGNQRAIWTIPSFGGSPAQLKSFEGTEAATSGSLVRLKAWTKEDESIYYEWNGNFYRLALANQEITKLTGLDPATQTVKDFALSPDGQEAVYATNARGQSDLWRVGLRGGAPRRLTNDKETDGYPVWQAGGRRLFYTSQREGKQCLYQVDAAGGVPSPVTINDQQCRVLDLAAGGRLLCYDQREESDIFAVQVTAGGEKQITADLGAELWSSVSPNGQTLAFHSLPGERFVWSVSKMLLLIRPLDNSQPPTQLAAEAFNAQWSPDGDRLAFLRQANQDYGLWIMRGFGGTEKQLVAAGVQHAGQANSPPYNRAQVKDYSWTPDGRQLAYCARQNGVFNVWQVTVDGARAEQVSGNTDPQAAVYCPLWSPDGRQLAYLADTGKPSAPDKPRWSVQVTGQGAPFNLLQSMSTVRVLGWLDNQHVLVAQWAAATTGQTATANLMLLALSGAAPRQLGTLTDTIFNSLQLAPAGQHLACVRAEDGRHDIWVMTLAAGRQSPLRKITNNTDPNLFYGSLAWSPDGKTIYYDRQTRWNMLTLVDNLD